MGETFVSWTDSPQSRRGRTGWVVQENGCHIWTGALFNGYGRASVGGRLRAVHRVRYEREVGPIPEGMDLDHFACENRACCNPAHVRPVTRRENLLRGATIVAEQVSRTHCKRGHPLSGANLLPDAAGNRRCRACSNLRLRAKSKKAKPRTRRHPNV